MSPILGSHQDALRKEASGVYSYYAEALMHLLVRTGRKNACKFLWPNLTRIRFISFVPESKWQYCLWRTIKGKYVEVEPPLTKKWDDLVNEARCVDCPDVPTSMKENKYLHLLFLILFPYRGTPAVVRSLAYCFDRTWFIQSPIGKDYE